MAKRPSIEVTPKSRLVGKTFGEYLLTPLIEIFLQDLRRLDIDEQEKFLLKVSKMCFEESKAAISFADNFTFTSEMAA
jgi:hypothetical protein